MSEIVWHPATESPGRKRFVGAYIKKGRNERHMTFSVVRFFEPDVLPCEVPEADKTELCVAWTPYEDFIKGITQDMKDGAKAKAWGWWNEEKGGAK